MEKMAWQHVFALLISEAVSEAVSQILKPCPMYLSHFPNILAISQISKSFSTFFSPLSNN